MVLLNLALWWFCRRSWRLGGCSSELLISNSRTSLFDAAISAGTGMALVSSPLLLGTPLAFMTPVSDSLIVLVLSAVFLPAPLQELGQAVSESAGASVEPALHQRCQNALAADFNNHGCSLVELAMIKLGRTFTVVAYVDPSVALLSSDVDRLRQRLNLQMQQLLQAPVLCEVIPTAEHPYSTVDNPG